MVLRHDDKPLQSTGPARADNLVCIELRRVQQRRILIAITPFAVGVGVESPMDDADQIDPLRKPSLKRRTWCGANRT